MRNKELYQFSIIGFSLFIILAIVQTLIMSNVCETRVEELPPLAGGDNIGWVKEFYGQ